MNSFHSAFLNIHRSVVLTALAWLVPHEAAAFLAHSVYTMQPYTIQPDTILNWVELIWVLLGHNPTLLLRSALIAMQVCDQSWLGSTVLLWSGSNWGFLHWDNLWLVGSSLILICRCCILLCYQWVSSVLYWFVINWGFLFYADLQSTGFFCFMLICNQLGFSVLCWFAINWVLLFLCWFVISQVLLFYADL